MSSSTGLEASIVAVLFTICIVVVLVGCLDCCRNSRFGFKVNYFLNFINSIYNNELGIFINFMVHLFIPLLGIAYDSEES